MNSLRVSYKRLFHIAPLRGFATSKLGQMNMLEAEEGLTQLNKFGEKTFIVNHTLVNQSVLLLPKSYLLWEPKSFQDISIDSLLPFTLLYPTVELLLIGTGESYSYQLPQELIKYFRSKGVVVEASATPYAASTFNVLNQEGRNVAAALLTMQPWGK